MKEWKQNYDSNTKCHFLAHHGVKRDSVATVKQNRISLSLYCLWSEPHGKAKYQVPEELLQFSVNLFYRCGDVVRMLLIVQHRFLWDPGAQETQKKGEQ